LRAQLPGMTLDDALSSYSWRSTKVNRPEFAGGSEP
jgi:hypothetical protein